MNDIALVRVAKTCGGVSIVGYLQKLPERDLGQLALFDLLEQGQWPR